MSCPLVAFPNEYPTVEGDCTLVAFATDQLLNKHLVADALKDLLDIETKEDELDMCRIPDDLMADVLEPKIDLRLKEDTITTEVKKDDLKIEMKKPGIKFNG